MQFDSIEYAVFLALVLALYWAVRHRRWQNVLLLVASYFFYGFWDWRFLSLIALSTILDYGCARAIDASTEKRRRKLFLLFSIVGNLGILGFYKYFDFFTQSAAALLDSFGLHVSPLILDITLPVGISFYTFQTMSYTIDVYWRRTPARHDFLDMALYVSFFPQLVAGPIERATNLLPQIESDRHLTRPMVYEGAWLIFWGVYKKVFVADNLARLVDPVYTDPAQASAPMLLLATYAFAFQIYTDFSSYTDIARGSAKLIGFDLILNFDLPYFAIDARDFWRRWHISLSQWLRDYLYIPLGGGKGLRWFVFRNLMITMALGGLWHGARWNFVLWGLFHGLLLVGYRIARPRLDHGPSGWRRALSILIMFHWTCLGWLFFRIESVASLPGIAMQFIKGWKIAPELLPTLGLFLVYTGLLIVMQFAQYLKRDLLIVQRFPAWLRVALYLVMYFSLTLGGAFNGRPFIYFQF